MIQRSVLWVIVLVVSVAMVGLSIVGIADGRRTSAASLATTLALTGLCVVSLSNRPWVAVAGAASALVGFAVHLYLLVSLDVSRPADVGAGVAGAVGSLGVAAVALWLLRSRRQSRS